ncbi:MAG: tyrosine-type recombinase/integrase [Pirellulales bacterium]
MGKLRARKTRRRVGRVSIYLHRRRWWVYYREHGRPVRKAVADDRTAAEQVASQINLELTSSAPTLFSFRPVLVAELQRSFIDYHEHIVRSSLATVSRYRTATQHLVNFGRELAAHEIEVEAFVRYLRILRVAPNGHANARRRALRDNGVRYILETCRSMYGYAAKRRHLPPYADNPFAGLGGKRARVEDAKPVFVFDRRSELAFLKAADGWAFGVHFLLAKLGLRPGELIRLLIEDVDLVGGWLHVRSRPELGAHTKTRRERAVPLIAEAATVLKNLIGRRTAGPVVLRQKADVSALPLANCDARTLAAAVQKRVAAAEAAGDEPLNRRAIARLHRAVWRDAGATRLERIRASFIQTAEACGLTEATCPKSWRHTFATLLQDANIDPLIRQLTLGHAPQFGMGTLGMTSVYTHTRPETQKREIERALRLWPESLELVFHMCKEV